LRAFAEMPQDTLIEDQRRAGKARPKGKAKRQNGACSNSDVLLFSVLQMQTVYSLSVFNHNLLRHTQVLCYFLS